MFISPAKGGVTWLSHYQLPQFTIIIFPLVHIFLFPANTAKSIKEKYFKMSFNEIDYLLFPDLFMSQQKKFNFELDMELILPFQRTGSFDVVQLALLFSALMSNQAQYQSPHKGRLVLHYTFSMRVLKPATS